MYAKAQYRKMGYFEGFVRKAVVVIPPHHELRKRTAMRNKEMGDPVPEDALNAMRGEERWTRRGGGGGGCKERIEGREGKVKNVNVERGRLHLCIVQDMLKAVISV